MPARTTERGTRWDIAPTPPPDLQHALADRLALEPVVARLLAARGHTDPDAANAFVNPRLNGLHDPSSLPGCDRAANRLLDAARAGEQIAIYGDYDVDGITATAILFHTIRHIAPAAELRTYVPHRVDEGYGLNADALRDLAGAGARVVVSVDCGITAHAPAAAARDAGVDLIITDHHNLPAEESGHPAPLPDAHTLVHPRLHLTDPDAPAYPYPDLCGAGVAFKLAWRLCTLAGGGEQRVDADMRELLMDLLALAALGTVADVVPLTGENRLIARFGLARFKSTRLAGVNALLEASSLMGEKVDAEAAGFRLAPRLNACGRMGHARAAVEMFTTATPGRAAEIARHLERQNDERRATERRIAEEAAAAAEAAAMTTPDARAIVLAHESWHPGVVGIVCSRLVERFRRPAILMQRADGRCKGSGRSIDGFNLHAALAACAEHLHSFGGHDMAAGLTLDETELDAFTHAFTRHAADAITDEMTAPRLAIDCDASLAELTVDAHQRIERLGPFGRANPRPTLLLRGVRLARHAETMGRHAKHLRLQVDDPAAGTRRSMKIIGWSMGELAPSLRAGQRLDLAIRPTVNRWNGSVTAEAELADFDANAQQRDAHPSGATGIPTTAGV